MDTSVPETLASIQTDRVDELTCSRCQSVLDVSEFDPFCEIDCPACGQKLSIPARLGPFILRRLLGMGGMGAIYQGEDSALGREVAVKVMLASLGNDPVQVETFRREARMAAALNHPNVVQIYSCGQERGQPYIVMELVSGRTMDGIMEHTGPMLDALAIGIGVDVAKGLSAGFDIGLIHGDIKPKNIIVDVKGTAKVVDFGLATFVDKQASEQGGIWGTPFYIAPEKVLKQPVDARSDIYSLGATLYHGIAGVPPFDGATPVDVVTARLKGPPKPLSEVRKEVLPKTNNIIMRMLEANPAKRYPTYLSLLGDLEDALVEAERSAGSSTLQAAKNAMLKRSSATKTVRHTPLTGLALPARPKDGPAAPTTGKAHIQIHAQGQGQGPAQAPKVLINLKSRKPRIEAAAAPVETEEELEERRKAQKAAAKRNRMISSIIAIIILVGGLAGAGIFWMIEDGKKQQQIKGVVLKVEAIYDGLLEPARKTVEETRQASVAVVETHRRYRASGHTKAAEIVFEAVGLYETAVAKANELDGIIAKATEANKAAKKSTSVTYALKNLEAMQSFPPVITHLREEIRRLGRQANELVAKAAVEPEPSAPPEDAQKPRNGAGRSQGKAPAVPE